MKTCHWFALSLLLLCNTTIQAQHAFKSGLYVGMNTSQVSGDALGDFNKAGVCGGVFVNHEFSNNWSAELSISYSEKGSKKSARPDKGDYTSYLLQLNYIEVPLLCRYTYSKFIFNAGMSFGRLIKSHEEDQYGTLNNNRPFNSWEFSAIGGVNYMINQHFQLIFMACNSLLPVRPHYSTSTHPYHINWEQLNSVLSLRISYTI